MLQLECALLQFVRANRCFGLISTGFSRGAPHAFAPVNFRASRSRVKTVVSQNRAAYAGPMRFTLLCAFLLSALAAAALPAPFELPLCTNLPDPLVRFNGHRVASREEWFAQRRPELQQLVQHYMYGVLPPAVKVVPTVGYVDTNFFSGKATLKLVTVGFAQTNLPPIQLMVVIPNQKTPAPVFVGLNFTGNHSLVSDAHVPVDPAWTTGKAPIVVSNHFTEAGRGYSSNDWTLKASIDRGYAVATFFYGDIEPDSNGATNGVRTLLPTPQHGSDEEWGAIAAWAWEISRVIDYLETEPKIDRKRIAAVGHSRLGKAVLLAGAMDERIALVFPHQAGCGGTAPSRGTVGESVAIINKKFPHWFCGAFKQFGEQPARLPFDQLAMVALCAPRPVLISCATEDTWSNPAGEFETGRAADPAFRFISGGGLDATNMPEPGKLIASRLGFFSRPGKHLMTPEDWAAFRDFADKYFAPMSAR
jgi:hypothetical protein